ncbi:unnamed protein product [Fusarium equiseti]|uniref:Uncharacterized protein n=1 Tax=Fusarium equiseti TaxID=61235 RepID=A0A8J2N8N3_FUSEQ|nr:unnamed protein product [Fusarium equiseti]
MRLFFYLSIAFLLIPVTAYTSANMSSAIGSVVPNGKSLYRVLLQKGTDPSEVVDLIKSAVGHDYISPWSVEDDGSVSAEFKAMPSQIEWLKGNKDIVTMTKIEFPIWDVTTPEGRRRFSETKYSIRPINGENLDQCNATGAILTTILEDKLRVPIVMDGRFGKWTAEMTDEQVVKIENLDASEL